MIGVIDRPRQRLRRSPSRPEPLPALPASLSTERSVAGCGLEAVPLDEVDLLTFVYDGPRLVVMALVALADAGHLVRPTHRVPRRTAGLANAYSAARLLKRSGCWFLAHSPVAECREVLDSYGDSCWLPFYVRRLKELAVRRSAAAAADRLALLARDERQPIDDVLKSLQAAASEAAACL